MKRAFLVACLLLACARSKEPTADTTTTATTTTTTSAPASCGSLGGACAREGNTCSPAPIGSGWSHMLTCRSGKWTEMEIAPLPQGNTQPAPPRTLPKLDVSCNADKDCTLINDEVEDSPPHTYACCASCTPRAVNAAWYKQFQTACAASPPPQCPPISCAEPTSHPVCRAHACELATK